MTLPYNKNNTSQNHHQKRCTEYNNNFRYNILSDSYSLNTASQKMIFRIFTIRSYINCWCNNHCQKRSYWTSPYMHKKVQNILTVSKSFAIEFPYKNIRIIAKGNLAPFNALLKSVFIIFFISRLKFITLLSMFPHENKSFVNNCYPVNHCFHQYSTFPYRFNFCWMFIWIYMHNFLTRDILCTS